MATVTGLVGALSVGEPESVGRDPSTGRGSGGPRWRRAARRRRKTPPGPRTGFRCLLVLFLAIWACQDSPVRPDRGFSQLVVSCSPSGATVSCTATLVGDPVLGRSGDVTAEATWLGSDPSLGGFSIPGLFTPVSDGEVGLWARYEDWESSEPHWFLVGPGTEARWLYFVAGTVSDAATGEPIAGAEVRILDGHAEGSRTTTNQVGSYTVERVLTGEDFTIEASMDGYSPLTQQYRVDPPVGPNGNPPFLDFRLEPAP